MTRQTAPRRKRGATADKIKSGGYITPLPAAVKNLEVKVDYPAKVESTFARARKTGQLKSLRDLAKVIVPKPQHGDRWGNWKLNGRDLTLEYSPPDGHWDYWVDLGHMHSSAEVLDSIAQVSGKDERCVSRKDIGDLVKALDDIFDLQDTFCSKSRRITKKPKVGSKLDALRPAREKASSARGA